MNIEKYSAYFHDGILIDILCQGSDIHISMSSAEVDPENFQIPMELSKTNCIVGILHLEKVQQIQISGEILLSDLLDVFDDGTILDFDIKDHLVELGISWTN